MDYPKGCCPHVGASYFVVRKARCPVNRLVAPWLEGAPSVGFQHESHTDVHILRSGRRSVWLVLECLSPLAEECPMFAPMFVPSPSRQEWRLVVRVLKLRTEAHSPMKELGGAKTPITGKEFRIQSYLRVTLIFHQSRSWGPFPSWGQFAWTTDNCTILGNRI